MLTNVRASVFGLIVVIAGSAVAAPPAPRAHDDKATIGMIELTGKPRETPGPLEWLFGMGEVPTLRGLVNALHEASTDDGLEGVVIRLKDAELSATQVQEIGAAMQQVRAAKKKVHVFAEGYDTTDLMLGSYADEVLAQQGGEVSFPGVYMEEMYLADTLSWIGLKADFVQVGDYKGASEPMARTGPSKEWDQNINQLLDSMYANVRKPIMQGRKLSDKKLDEVMETAWMADAGEAVKAGLIDKEVDLADLTDYLKKEYGKEIDWDDELLPTQPKTKPDMNPFAIMGMLSKKPEAKPTKPTIAVVHIDGAIIDGDSKGGGMFGGEGQVGSRTLRNALEDVMDEDMVKGVVVRIDSPGGSATASEIIWQGIRRVAEKKPVWVSVGSMAASGGYYCAVAGDKIYVNPSSIVGSIGVVGGKISMQGLYDLLKVHVVGRGRGPRAGMFASSQPWSPQDKDMVRSKMTQTYTLFTKRVTAGRKGIDLSTTAEGRLFTGDKSISMKMADAVGGLDDCIKDLAKDRKLDEYGVQDYPLPKSLGEVIEDAAKGFGVMAPRMGSRAPMSGDSAAPIQLLAGIRELVGPRVWSQLEPSLSGMFQLRDEPVLLMSPRVLIIK
jgi:protease-4